jgi:uncharacterized protein YdeI (YjbR/CyaY-like superfamily)
MPEKPKDNLPVILFETEKQWNNWLETNGNTGGVWMRIAKKKSKLVSINYDQALEVALCFGWIDGLKKAFDDDSWIQRFSPRKPASKWSKINRTKAQRLIKEGKMREPGFETIKIAKEKRTWQNAYDSPKNARVPSYLKAELDKNSEAAAFFKTLDPINRYAIIYRLQIAKTAEIREKKMHELIQMLLEKRKIHHLK